jgi:hypothetical protein
LTADFQGAMVEEVLENSLPVHVAILEQAKKENAAEKYKLLAQLSELKVTKLITVLVTVIVSVN